MPIFLTKSLLLILNDVKIRANFMVEPTIVRIIINPEVTVTVKRDSLGLEKMENVFQLKETQNVWLNYPSNPVYVNSN